MNNTQDTEAKQRARLPYEMSINGKKFTSLTALMRKHGFDQARVGNQGPLQFLQAFGIPVGVTVPLGRGETYYIHKEHTEYTENCLRKIAVVRDEKEKAAEAAKVKKADSNADHTVLMDQTMLMFTALQRQIQQQNEMLARQNAMLETVLSELGVKERNPAKPDLRAVG